MVDSVLVVSASMGAGHDGAAAELCRRLEADGIRTRTVDFLDAAPWAGRLIKRVYELQLASAPWAYEATYRIWFAGPVLCAPLACLLTLVFGRRLRQWAAELGASTVVSTYPLASVVLGRLRRRRYRRLAVPAVTFVTDFAVHPLWVHRGIDLNLCVHPDSAAQAARTTGRPARSPGPLVTQRFRSKLPGRGEAREQLGLPAGARVALVVAGSWGVGEVEQTFDALLATGTYLPVVVCGTNEELRRRLAARGQGVVLGWTDAMPALMAAADVLVQNAGGLTCMEAFAVGLPVVSYRPIPGHGRQNAIDMERAGVAAFATGPVTLGPVLDHVIDGSGEMTGLGKAMFSGDAAGDVKEIVAGSQAIPLPTHYPLRRRLVAATAAVVALYAGTNVAADAATAHGIDAPPRPRPDVSLVVRLGPPALADPSLAALLARDHIVAAVEGSVARAHPGDLRRLGAAGVSVANAGWGAEPGLHLLLARDDVTRSSQAIAAALGHRCRLFAPEAGVNDFDLVFAMVQHEQIVRGIPVAADRAEQDLAAGHTYILDAERATGPQLAQRLDALHRTLVADHLTVTALPASR